MVDVAERSRRQPVELDEAGSTPVVHPKAEAPGAGWSPKPAVAGSTPASVAICAACASADLAKIKGCVRCLRCGFKEDCNGW